MLALVSIFVCVAATPVAMAMESMADDALAESVGQEGIGLQLELRINADATGQPLTTAGQLTRAANASDYTNCGSLTNFSSTGCRLAIQFANRMDGGGEWLVAKNFYGRIVIPLMYLNSNFTPSAATSYVDLSRFKDKNGVPLLASPNGIALVELSFPKEIEIWNLTIGALSIEYGATGYLSNVNKSVGGIKVSNSVPGYPATVNIQGTIGVYGF